MSSYLSLATIRLLYTQIVGVCVPMLFILYTMSYIYYIVERLVIMQNVNSAENESFCTPDVQFLLLRPIESQKKKMWPRKREGGGKIVYQTIIIACRCWIGWFVWTMKISSNTIKTWTATDFISKSNVLVNVQAINNKNQLMHFIALSCRFHSVEVV